MLEIGSIVKIKDNLCGDYPSGVNSRMKECSGKVTKITDIIDLNKYRIECDKYGYTWNKEMFENGDNPYYPSTVTIGQEFNSEIFGKLILVNISDDQDYPYELKLEDGDIISVTKEFKFFKNSKKSIF